MRILFITATRIGDAVISTGLLSHLIKQNPGASVTVACGPLAESLFTSVPGLDRVIVLSKSAFSGHWFRLWNDVRKQRWDIVVDLRRSLIPYLVRTRHRYRLGPDDHKSHRVALLSQLFDLTPPSPPTLWISAEQEALAEAMLTEDRPVVALCPTAARREKTWPVEQFSGLAQAIIDDPQEFSNANVLLVGAEEDRPVLDQIASLLPKGRSTILAGCPNLQCVAAVLSRCAVTVANDSGLAHLAAAAGSPTVALFGPTRADLYKPWGMRVAVVQAPEIQCERSIEDIKMSDVLAGIHSVLD
ncbi:MAG: glycosyltransferase family 9 protein [Rhodospirillaceae bacterium]|jgi:heptosyltransferase III|nr:glycosyltransferase family 9 protein [Rhodospirillaceae bacterium]MBT5240419.1 glycosyltransferase family 9 protein [Rhodospirillaceae bacterium]MBT5566713.1 glycosyltransferase family 9 protein [Rhodospirillaceae bacterium]MBT6090764.1 glycosyltransferase family 9 protein [Rhodospirillaceae bacterium]MBT7449235.1 glycosyltransferase family 9 protein [Rhodospirillaceae bacterium]